MLQIGISRIPDRHIMNRWTRVARDVLPDEMNFYHSESLPVQTLTYRHRLLAASATRIVTEGDHDAETFEIATKHMDRAFMEIEDYRLWVKPMGLIVTMKGVVANMAMVLIQMERLMVTAMGLQVVVLF
jgi:hypothetical protein